MKTKHFPILLLLFFSFLFLNLSAQNLPEVISLRELELNKETNEIIFLNYYNQWCDMVSEHSKGVGGWVMKGDRGNRNGEYVFAWTFNFKSTRDYYFPSNDMSNYPQWQAVLSKIHFHAPEKPLVDSIRSYTDFVVLGFDKMIAPQLGEIIAVRYFNVEEEKVSEFEDFVLEEYHPAFQNHIEGYYNYVLKGDRGDKVGSYLMLTVFDNADRRDQYFPVPLDPPSDDFNNQWLEVEAISEKFNDYLIKNVDHDYTDYIVVF
jgi:hypothetical protein